MQLLVMQHQEHWLSEVSKQLLQGGKNLATIRTWLRLPYCIGAHMDRDGCTFAYLSPDANAAGQRAWLHFQPINWRNGGLERIARTFMELEVRGVASFGLRVTGLPLAAGEPHLLGLDCTNHASSQPSPCSPATAGNARGGQHPCAAAARLLI